MNGARKGEETDLREKSASDRLFRHQQSLTSPESSVARWPLFRLWLEHLHTWGLEQACWAVGPMCGSHPGTGAFSCGQPQGTLKGLIAKEFHYFT